MNDKKILITGGSGFIGTNLVENYLQQGYKVLNLDIAPPRNVSHKPFWKRIDILDRATLLQTVSDFQPIFFLHFAARTDLDEHNNLAGYAANIEGICNVIDAVRATPSIRRAIFASSQLVCRLGYIPKDDYDYNPTTLYGHSKALGERIIRTTSDFNAIWTIVRPTSIWGPWFGIPYKNFFEAIAKNMYIHTGSIKTLKQWGFVGNTVFQMDNLIHAAREDVHQKTFYLADYQPIDLHVFANQVQKAIGARSIRTIPNGLMKILASGGDILQVLGWKGSLLTSFRYSNIATPEIQDLEPLRKVVGPLPFKTAQGIDLTVQWLKEHNN
jgi:nucleoside-diphosphate-sugar epimerase